MTFHFEFDPEPYFSEKKKERRQDGLFDEEDLNRQWHELFGEWKILNKYVVQFHTELKKHLRLFHDHDYFNVMHALRFIFKFKQNALSNSIAPS